MECHSCYEMNAMYSKRHNGMYYYAFFTVCMRTASSSIFLFFLGSRTDHLGWPMSSSGQSLLVAQPHFDVIFNWRSFRTLCTSSRCLMG